MARAPAALGWLGADEQRRWQAIRSTPRRAQFVAGRWLLRELLAASHGGAPADWRLGVGDQGPPMVLAGATQPRLALSHSGDRVAAAVAGTPVGIDIEQPTRTRDLEGLALLCCTPQERALIAAGQAAFYELWTAKEAWLKRHGEGVDPARLQAVELLPAQADLPDVGVWFDAGGYLAISGAHDLTWLGPDDEAMPAPLSAWRVQDRRRPASHMTLTSQPGAVDV